MPKDMIYEEKKFYYIEVILLNTTLINDRKKKSFNKNHVSKYNFHIYIYWTNLTTSIQNQNGRPWDNLTKLIIIFKNMLI